MEIKKLFVKIENDVVIFPSIVDGEYVAIEGYDVPAVKMSNGTTRFLVMPEFMEFSYSRQVAKVIVNEFWEINGVLNPIGQHSGQRIFPNGYLQIDNSVYCDATTGEEEPAPYEDNLDDEKLINGESYDPKQYNQKLKAGLTTSWRFWYNFLKPYQPIPIQNKVAEICENV